MDPNGFFSYSPFGFKECSSGLKGSTPLFDNPLYIWPQAAETCRLTCVIFFSKIYNREITIIDRTSVRIAGGLSNRWYLSYTSYCNNIIVGAALTAEGFSRAMAIIRLQGALL